MFKLKPQQYLQVFLRRFTRRDLLVNFVIGGTQKGGTSALFDLLSQHPEIGLPDRKELHYFDRDRYFKNPGGQPAVFHSFYSSPKRFKILGEATPIYMYWHPVPGRIQTYNPRMKWILILRHPVDRAYSHWNMETQKGNEVLPFREAIQQEKDRLANCPDYQHRIFSYTDRGFYSHQIKRLLEYFPKDQILVLRNRQLREHPESALEQVCDFLELPLPPRFQARNVHSRPYQSEMASDIRQILLDIYREEVQSLEELLDWDCSDWKR